MYVSCVTVVFVIFSTITFNILHFTAAGMTATVYIKHLRHIAFPMFQKHKSLACGGIHLHPTEPKKVRTWRAGALLLREFYQQNDFAFQWNDSPYEYQYENLAIDYINGGTSLRKWVEENGSLEDLLELEKKNWPDYLNLREDMLIYSH